MKVLTDQQNKEWATYAEELHEVNELLLHITEVQELLINKLKTISGEQTYFSGEFILEKVYHFGKVKFELRKIDLHNKIVKYNR